MNNWLESNRPDFRKYLLPVLLIQLGCSMAEKRHYLYSYDLIADLQTIPQVFDELQLSSELKKAGTIKADRKVLIQQFKRNFFLAWEESQKLIPMAELEQEVKNLGICYGENYQKKSSEWYQKQVQNENLENLGSMNQPAMALRHTNLRVLPTIQPCFHSPSMGGEGYPFDYLQFSLLYVGTPVALSHFSKDLAWAFIKTNTNEHGWIRSEDVGIVADQDQKSLKNYSLGILTTDDEGIYGANHSFLSDSHVGTVLPVVTGHKNSVIVKFPYSLQPHDSKTFVQFKNVSIDADHILLRPLDFSTLPDIQFAFSRFVNKPYGWGSYLGNRDCAGMIKDFYSLFYLNLPAFSGHQLMYGQVVDVARLSINEKLTLLTEKMQPFKTLLYHKGHIGIYAGLYDQRPIMFHSVWGVKTKTADLEGRNILAKSVVTSLEYGKDLINFDKKSGTFLEQLESIVVIAD
jgi:hypothetical protein